MKISVLVENTSRDNYCTEHGLSLYIALNSGKNILFDMGQGNLFLKNAQLLGCDIKDVDSAIISHGHYDHGGGLRYFMNLNDKANVYIQQAAFEPHYSMKEFGLKYIGLDESLKTDFCDRLVMCGGICALSEGVTLFTCSENIYTQPEGNSLLYGSDKKSNDDFSHEQSVLITEGDRVVLFAGCAHCGILNIMHTAEKLSSRKITHVIAGFHLMKTNDNEQLMTLAQGLLSHETCSYYTLHCTGTEQYEMLRQYMNNRICYLSCGDSIEI